MVEADWAAQEQRRGRGPSDPEAIRDALTRAERLLATLADRFSMPQTQDDRDALCRLKRDTAGVEDLDEAGRRALYYKVRGFTRTLALKNPLIADKPLVFLKRRRFICQMLHEYLGYYYNRLDIAGGEVCVLPRPGHSLEPRDLIGDRLPRGSYTTLSLSHDAKTIYFAFAKVDADVAGRPKVGKDYHALKNYGPAPKCLDYYSPERSCFHIYAMDADGRNLRQLTDGVDDDFDPCPLPDGGIAFMSTRRGGFGRCHHMWEPLPAYTLHRMDASGKHVRTLSFHETNQWHPAVLGDGRIVYSRWDYIDRSAAHFHGLWVSNPDGSRQNVLFGNYTQRINACYQPKPIPGSNRILFVAGAHHAAVGGSLVILDPARVKLDPDTGEDQFDAIETLTPDVCFPEAPDWPGSYFHSPWPLSEDFFLVSFSFERLPGTGSGERRDTYTGLYYFDRFGNLELLYRDEDYSAMYPIPLVPRSMPPTIPSTPDAGLVDEGEFVLADVKQSLMPLDEDRPIRQLRIFQVLPKTTTHAGDQPKIGNGKAELARMLLGTVPVEEDGSAYFRAPAKKPIYFQAVDAAGRAVQTMRSVVYLQPGEQRGCVGCHEPPSIAPTARRGLLALRRPASTIRPGPEGTLPMSYARLVQPVLDRHCVRCHDGKGSTKAASLDLTSRRTEPFTKSYESLRPYVRWYEWGDKTIHPVVTTPGHGCVDESPLTAILDDAVHAPEVKLSNADRRKIYSWLDGNSPFYGTYTAEARESQRAGKPVPTPRVQ